MRRLLLSIGISFLLLHPLFAFNQFFYRSRPQEMPSNIYGNRELANALNDIVNTDTTAAIAVYVKSMMYGDDLYRRNVSYPLIPASTMKIFTAEAALLYLGPNFRFSTQLLTDAPLVRDGVLQGNLYVVLSGDPTLTYSDLGEMVDVLRAQQITAIAGNVYIDNTAYDQNFYGPGWMGQDKSYCYAAPISASIVNHNCYAFSVTPGKKAGNAANIVTSSKYFYPSIKNYVTTKPRSRNCVLHLSKTDRNSAINIDGCMPSGKVSWGVSYVVTDIPDYNRSLFRTLLRQNGIKTYGLVTFGRAKLSQLNPIATHTSRPLHLIVGEMLKKSDNIIAGALFKKLGQKV